MAWPELGIGPKGGDVEKAVLEGDLPAAAGDGFWVASEMVDYVAVVAVQHIDEGVPAGKEHDDVGASPVLRGVAVILLPRRCGAVIRSNITGAIA